MEVLHVRNVEQAYHSGLRLIRQVGESQPSRNGPVLVAPYPVCTVYDQPQERVLFDEARDANPFFHLFESIWMLAGRNDAAFLDRFVRDFGTRYAEPQSGTLHGAYGHRWRHSFDVDQLDVCVRRLQRDASDRRVVITMWDPTTDLIGPDDVDPETMESVWLDYPEPRDLPCNTQIYLRVRSVPGDFHQDGTLYKDDSVLDLTVMCRSNDIIWGAYGANAVHFSVLQEYLAARVGVSVGKMYQLSNNWHAYKDVLDKYPDGTPRDNPYITLRPVSMVDQPMQFLRDCERFCTDADRRVFANRWFNTTALPMLRAHQVWRSGDMLQAQRLLDNVEAPDWQQAARLWLGRRAK